MKSSRYSPEQVAFGLRQAEEGTPVAEVCRKMGIAEQTFYRWKKKFQGMGVAEVRRLRILEEENRKLNSWWRISAWTSRCCRMCCEKSPRAYSDERSCRLSAGGVWGEPAAGLPGGSPFDVPPADTGAWRMSRRPYGCGSGSWPGPG